MLKTTNFKKGKDDIIMKKFKKIVAMGCAAVMAMSVMSMSAFATDELTSAVDDYTTYEDGANEDLPPPTDMSYAEVLDLINQKDNFRNNAINYTVV